MQASSLPVYIVAMHIYKVHIFIFNICEESGKFASFWACRVKCDGSLVNGPLPIATQVNPMLHKNPLIATELQVIEYLSPPVSFFRVQATLSIKVLSTRHKLV